MPYGPLRARFFSFDSIAGQCSVVIDPRYTHLGSYEHVGGSNLQFVTKNVQNAKIASSDNRALLTNSNTAIKSRVVSHRALVLSRLFFHFGFLPRINKKCSNKISRAYDDLWHAIFHNSGKVVIENGVRLSTKELYEFLK